MLAELFVPIPRQVDTYTAKYSTSPTKSVHKYAAQSTSREHCQLQNKFSLKCQKTMLETPKKIHPKIWNYLVIVKLQSFMQDSVTVVQQVVLQQ